MNSDDVVEVVDIGLEESCFLSESDSDQSLVSQAQDEVPCSTASTKVVTVYDIPEEILEHIIMFLSPYQEMDAAKLVSKQWNQVVKSVIKQLKRKFYQSLFKCDISWVHVAPETQAGQTVRLMKGISARFSHSALYYDGSLYVFGGCTSTNTTFNDLWRLDLTTRQWIRPIAMGTYPSPKACATMVEYNGNLVLFGGWSHPIPYPLHQPAHYFSELHVYSIATNKWSHVVSLGQEPEALGGHSASVAGHLMVVFGGSPRPGMGTNNLWVFDFVKGTWTLQSVFQDVKPEPRCGQFQTTLDEKHILVMGGCVGQYRVYNDLWLLTMHETDPWQWTKLTVKHPELAASQTWCHAACRVKDIIVVLSKSSKVRQTRNVGANTRRKSGCSSSENSSSSSTDGSPVSPHSLQLRQTPSPQHQHSSIQDVHLQEPQLRSQYQNQFQQMQQQPLPLSQQQPPPQSQQQQLAGSVNSINVTAREAERAPQPSSSLLYLQQRLHRDCLNIQDPSNHHQNAAQIANEEDAEGHFHRISNRWQNEDMHHAGTSQNEDHLHHTGTSQNHLEQQENSHRQSSPQMRKQNGDQPQFGSLQRLNNNHVSSGRARSSGSMPSIRPNSMNNRQKQLEALQRQEELLRSKSHALAAARVLNSNDSSDDTSPEQIPDLISTRNKMDAHILDISRVLTEGVAEWRPLNELQPPGAPTETKCCSLLEGRGELIMFGGVVRNLVSPVMTTTAVNKLYILKPE